MRHPEGKGIQRLVFNGYSFLPECRFLLLGIGQSDLARSWLGGLIGDITVGYDQGLKSALHIAFTFEGFKLLGLPPASLEGFSRPFQEGMLTEHRRRILGDHDESDPKNWAWGGTNETVPFKDTDIHVLLMVYADTASTLEERCGKIVAELQAKGLKLLTPLLANGALTTKHREHFGFHDGIAQPDLAESADAAPNSVRWGEFLLGYPNEYGILPPTSDLPAADDPQNLLPAGEAGRKDFGRNGTYLVIRQLRQDVRGFWDFISKKTSQVPSAEAPAARVKLAARMVGRWPSGAPLVLSPRADDAHLADENTFLYSREDASGAKCPLGSHVRRTNPRDVLTDDPEQSMELAKRHRLIRRGRPYGPVLADSLAPEDILGASQEEAEKDRGLYFIALNADISRQFEFVQQTWINNPKFAGLYNDADPLMGDHYPPGKGVFTIQSDIRERLTELRRFVTTRGGGYFFMPGLDALKYLASCGRASSPAGTVPTPGAAS